MSGELRKEIMRLMREDFDPTPAVLQGFADCEALVVAMLTALADDEQEKANLSSTTSEKRANSHASRSCALSEAALAVSMGQHRTDAYDADELRQAHARAAVKPGMQSAGGKARMAALTPKQRSKQASKAIKTRWAKVRKESAE